jgi:uridylate kinase
MKKRSDCSFLRRKHNNSRRYQRQILKEFKKVILFNREKYKFVIVCGGGSIARKYINALKDNQ